MTFRIIYLTSLLANLVAQAQDPAGLPPAGPPPPNPVKVPETEPIPLPSADPVAMPLDQPGLIADPGLIVPGKPSPAKSAKPQGGAINDPLRYPIAVDESINPVPLRGITLYLDTRRDATQSAESWTRGRKSALPAGVVIRDGLETPGPGALQASLRKFIGRNPFTFGDLQEAVEIIQNHHVERNRPMTHVFIPKQSFYSDRVVIGIIEGRVGDTKVVIRQDEDSGRWASWYNAPYSPEKLEEEFRPRTDALRGKIVDTEVIQAHITGMNRSPWVRLNRPVEHPFRELSVNFAQPGPNVLGTTDLSFEIHDERPLKFFTGVDNTLTDLTGENRFFLGGAWYDAFKLGKDHQLGAQIFSALDPDEMMGLSLNYQIPWKNSRYDQFTDIFTSYANSAAEVILGGIPTDSEGDTIIFGGRHYFELPELYGATDLTMPLGDDNPWKTWAAPIREPMGIHHEAGVGFDFKSSDNDLLFGGTSVAESPADVVQLVVEYNARQTDPTGETNFAAHLFFSPGDVTSDNSDEAFEALRLGAEASYFYTRLRLDREQDLPFEGKFKGMLLKAGLTVQYSSANLMASEQLGLGGYNSVRGYPERVLRGDIGYVFNLELASPELHPARQWFKSKKEDNLRFLLFADYAHGESVEENPSDPLDDDADLMSVGLGFRYEFEDYLRLRLDYGVRLEDLSEAADDGEDGALHFGLIYVF